MITEEHGKRERQATARRLHDPAGPSFPRHTPLLTLWLSVWTKAL